MNRQVRDLARVHQLDQQRFFLLRVVYALDCVEWAKPLIEDSRMSDALSAGHQFVSGEMDFLALQRVANEAKMIALSHPAHGTIDSTHHATVSASFGVARALAGDAWNAAEYAAYALVYAQSESAVMDPDSFVPLYNWQYSHLQIRLAEFGVVDADTDHSVY